MLLNQLLPCFRRVIPAPGLL